MNKDQLENLKDKIENLKLKTLQGFVLSIQEELELFSLENKLELILLEDKLKTLERDRIDKQ